MTRPEKKWICAWAPGSSYLVKVRNGSMLLKNSQSLVFDSDSIPDAVVAQATPYAL
jgi:hypothetical protein